MHSLPHGKRTRRWGERANQCLQTRSGSSFHLPTGRRHRLSVKTCSSILRQCMSEKSTSALSGRHIPKSDFSHVASPPDAHRWHGLRVTERMLSCMQPALPNLSCVAVAAERRVSCVKPLHSSFQSGGTRGSLKASISRNADGNRLDAGQRTGRSGEAALWGTSGNGLKHSSCSVHRTYAATYVGYCLSQRTSRPSAERIHGLHGSAAMRPLLRLTHQGWHLPELRRSEVYPAWSFTTPGGIRSRVPRPQPQVRR